MNEHAAGLAAADARLAASRAAMAHGLAAAVVAPAAPSHSIGARVLDAVEADALHHPVRAGWQLAEHAARDRWAPLVHEHPWRLVGAGLLAGAALAAARPWRWVLPPSLLSGVVSQLALRSLAGVLAVRPRGEAAPPPRGRSVP